MGKSGKTNSFAMKYNGERLTYKMMYIILIGNMQQFNTMNDEERKKFTKIPRHFYIPELDNFAFYIDGFFELDLNDHLITKYFVSLATEYENDTGIPWFDLVDPNFIPNIIKKYKQKIPQLGYSIKYDEFNRFSKIIFDKESGKITNIIINFKNTTIEIDPWSNSIKERGQSHDDLFLSSLDIDWDSNANYPIWELALEQWIPDSFGRDFLRNWYASAFLNKYFKLQKSPFLYGPQAFNGKTTICNALSKPFRKVADIEPDDLEGFNREPLVDSDFFIADDVDRKFQVKGVIKRIISGSRIYIQRKNQRNLRNVLLDFKGIFNSEDLPQYLTEGAKRRFEFILCPNSFEDNDDFNLDEKLEAEKSGIVLWAIKSIPNLIRNVGEFKRGSKERTNKFYEETNNPLYILDAYIIEDPDLESNSYEMTSVYNMLAKKEGLKPYEQRSVGRFIGSRYILERTDNGKIPRKRLEIAGQKHHVSIYKGIGLDEQKLSSKIPKWRGYLKETTQTSVVDFEYNVNITGNGKSRLKRLTDIIDALVMSNYNGMFEEALLLKKAEENGLDHDYTWGVIQQMRRDGVLFQPIPGYLERVNRNS